MSWTTQLGDLAKPFNATIMDGTSVYAGLADATLIELRYRAKTADPSDNASWTSVTLTLVDADAGTVTHTWIAGELPQVGPAGDYPAQIRVHFGAVIHETIPAGATFLLQIKAAP